MFSFADLGKKLVSYLSPEQVESVHQAFILAEEAHHGQQRASGEPYISHPVAVADILADMHLDPETIMAAMLHDVIEDTAVDKKTLIKKFGAAVAELVDGVSKLNQMEFATRAEAQAENFRKMLLAMVRDIRVILVKLADRLHNMRTLDVLSSERRSRIAKETLDIYAPIANRLGMYRLRLELEDLSFKALHPLRYQILQNKLQQAHGNRREIIHSIEEAIYKKLQERKIKKFSVYGRDKHLYSIYQKMKHKHLAFNEIMDMYGFRVITSSVDDCYRVLGVTHSIYKPLPGRVKDYIAIPKANNYQSVHTTLFGPYGVPIEVQIRTEEMDRLAENGIAAHWNYKISDVKESARNKKPLNEKHSPWLKSLEQIQQQEGAPLEFIENVKIDLFPDEVYVFTPKGDILELAAGATVVDFAYALDPDIGNQCVSAKINRQLAALSTPLENGQTIEVITANGARPNPAWLNFVVSGKARSHIRHFLKGQRRVESINLGKRLLEAALHPLRIQIEEVPPAILEEISRESGLDSIDSLYEEMGLGQRIPVLEARRLALMSGRSLPDMDAAMSAPLLIKGTEGLVVQFATCCRAIPGDPIVGYLEMGHGLTIHRENCPVIKQYYDRTEKCMAVEWEKRVRGDFSTELHLELSNQRGMLALLAASIADMDANIEDIKTETRDGRNVQMNLILSVHDRQHLARVIRRLRTVKGILRIHRALNQGQG